MVSEVQHDGCGEDDNIVEVTMQPLFKCRRTGQDLLILVRTELNARGDGDQHVAGYSNLGNGWC